MGRDVGIDMGGRDVEYGEWAARSSVGAMDWARMDVDDGRDGVSRLLR